MRKEELKEFLKEYIDFIDIGISESNIDTFLEFYFNVPIDIIYKAVKEVFKLNKDQIRIGRKREIYEIRMIIFYLIRKFTRGKVSYKEIARIVTNSDNHCTARYNYDKVLDHISIDTEYSRELKDKLNLVENTIKRLIHEKKQCKSSS